MKITTEEAAARLRMSIHFVRSEIKKGKLIASKIGKAYLIDEKDLDAYFIARRVVSTPCASK